MRARSWLPPTARVVRKPTEGTPDHFEKLLEGPCPNHSFPVEHLYKDCDLLRWFLCGGYDKEEHRKEPS